MTISIDNKKERPETAIKLISEWERDNCACQILGAWHKSQISHRFKNKGIFKEAIRRNREALKFRLPEIKNLFTAKNYQFSTEAPGTKQTLYFASDITKQTGRLRQQHRKGPLAQIDENPRTHIFPRSKHRLMELEKRLNKWKHRKGHIPRLRAEETQPTINRYHIEFSDGKHRKVHKSRGRVNEFRRSAGRVRSALNEILGIRQMIVHRGQDALNGIVGTRIIPVRVGPADFP